MGTLYIVSIIGTMIKSIYSTDYQTLIDWLKEERLAQELSMRELAQKLDVSHSFVGKVEQRERRLDVVEYIAYCRALNISPTDGIKLIL